jgi:class 3 adenylate cyclase
VGSTRHKRLRRAEPKPYSAKELAKHIDPILLNDLGWLTFLDKPEPKRLTVIFWDISGFSAMCEDFDRDRCPEGIVLFLNEYFKRAIKIIKSHNGVLDKFMGDGILAYFGYNRTKNGDPFNAVSAALEFKKQFPTFKRFFAESCKINYGKEVILPYDLKCGINNGPAFVHYFNTI